jgi:hypothetical protein
MKTFLPVVFLLAGVTLPAVAGATSLVPEPSTMLLVGGGLGAAILIARRRRNRNH